MSAHKEFETALEQWLDSISPTGSAFPSAADFEEENKEADHATQANDANCNY